MPQYLAYSGSHPPCGPGFISQHAVLVRRIEQRHAPSVAPSAIEQWTSDRLAVGDALTRFGGPVLGSGCPLLDEGLRRQCEVCVTLPGFGGIVPFSRGPGSSAIG